MSVLAGTKPDLRSVYRSSRPGRPYGLVPARASSSSDDWRSFRASLIMSERAEEDASGIDHQATASLLRKNEALISTSNPELVGSPLWAVPTTVLEKGSVIVAASALSEAATLLMQHRQEAVIFITKHDADGTRGLILNRPTSLMMGRTLIQSENGETSLRRLFEENVLMMGGAHIQESVEILHQRPDVWEASNEVIPGIWAATGDVPADLDSRLALANCASAERKSQFKFFCGSEDWRPGELQLEINEGMWTLCSVSPAIVAKACLSLPCPLWLEVSLRLGGETGEAASLAYASLLGSIVNDGE